MKPSIVVVFPLILAVSDALAQTVVTDTPLPASAYGNAMGVVTHFDRTSGGVYSVGQDVLSAGHQAITLMTQLPVNHYRTKYVDTRPDTGNQAFAARLKEIADNSNAKADFIIDLRRNCIAPPLEGSATTVYVSVSASPAVVIDDNTPVMLTATLCVADDGSTHRPEFKGTVAFYVDTQYVDAVPVDHDTDRATKQVYLSKGSHTIRAQYSDVAGSQPAYYQSNKSDCLVTPTSAAPVAGCGTAPKPSPLPAQCFVGNGDPLVSYNSSQVVTGRTDLLTDNQWYPARDRTNQLKGLFQSIQLDDLTKTGWIEGPNEFDTSHNDPSNNDTQWKTFLAAFIRGMFNQRPNYSLTGVPFVAPSMGSYQHSQDPTGDSGCNQPADPNSPISVAALCTNSPLGVTPACFDYANTHAYPQPDPSTNMSCGLKTAYSISPTQIQIGGNTKPVYTFQTETGYENAPYQDNGDSVHPSVTQSVAAKYGPRTIAESLYSQNHSGALPGINLINFYQLVDEDTGAAAGCAGNDQANFGLISVDVSSGSAQLTPKPIYYTLQNSLQTVKDTADPADLSQVTYTFRPPSGSTALPQRLLLKNSGNSYFLLLWQQTPLWYRDKQTNDQHEISVDSINTVVKFPNAIGSSSPNNYDYSVPSTTPSTVTWTHLSPRADGSVILPVGGELTILRVTPQN